ncbi:unnamed protein product, partial [Prorocentrum cordatum]
RLRSLLDRLPERERYLSNTLIGATEAWDIRIRQRARGAASGRAPSELKLMELRAALSGEEGPAAAPVPDTARAALELLLATFKSNEEDQRAVTTALRAASMALPLTRWRFKEAVLKTLVALGADAWTVTALLLHDLDDGLGLPWACVSEAITKCRALGAEVVSVIEEKKRLEQLALLLFLRAFAQREDHAEAWPAASQFLRTLYLKRSEDFRGVLVEIAEVEQMLRDMLLRARSSEFEVPLEGRALARCVLDLHAPLAHGLGLDALARSRGGAPSSAGERLTPSLEQMALRLHFPVEYRMIEDWMSQEDALLGRTMARCMTEVRRALEREPCVSDLATFSVKGRVKSVCSLVKKLLRQRGMSRMDLKAEAVKDLLALEVVVIPNLDAAVPNNPEWLAEDGHGGSAPRASPPWTRCRTTRGRHERLVGPPEVHQGLHHEVEEKRLQGAAHHPGHERAGAPAEGLQSSAAQGPERHHDAVQARGPHLLRFHEAEGAPGLGRAQLLQGLRARHGGPLRGPRGRLHRRDRGRGPAAGGLPRGGELDLWGESFAPDYVDGEIRELCAPSDRTKDGRLSLGDARHAQKAVVRKLEDFQRALQQRQQRWWMHGVHAPAASFPAASAPSVTWSWGIFRGSPGVRDKVSILDHALGLAKEAHEGQLRRSGDPYWTHPLSVADLLARLLLPPTDVKFPAREGLSAAEALES